MPDPTPTTVKRLYALSGNKSAFPGCTNDLVDGASGVVTAAICHIKAKNPGAKRYDPRQTDDQRRALGNLMLLCPIHHTIIDTDPDDTYTSGLD